MKLLKIITLTMLLLLAPAAFSPPTKVAAALTGPSTSQTNLTNDVVVESSPSPALDKRITSKARSKAYSYLTRTSGLIALDLLIVLMASGVGLITGLTFTLIEPLVAWATHRALGMAFSVILLIHILSICFGKLSVGIFVQALVPFVKSPDISGGQPGSRLYLALGIGAMYGVMAIMLSSLLWKEKKPQRWKQIHFLSYAVIALSFFHAFYMGTDLSHGMVRWIFEATALLVIVLSLLRLRRMRSM